MCVICAQKGMHIGIPQVVLVPGEDQLPSAEASDDVLYSVVVEAICVGRVGGGGVLCGALQ